MHCINAVWPDNNYVFSYLRMLTTWHCPHSLASRCMLQQSIDVSCRRAHSNKPAASCCSGRVGQTDGQTPYRFIDPASHTMRAVPIKSCITYELESVVIYKFSGQSRRNVAFLCLYHFVSVFQLARCLHNYHPASCIDDVATIKNLKTPCHYSQILRDTTEKQLANRRKLSDSKTVHFENVDSC